MIKFNTKNTLSEVTCFSNMMFLLVPLLFLLPKGVASTSVLLELLAEREPACGQQTFFWSGEQGELSYR